MATPAVVVASRTSPPTIKLVAPASDVTVKVRIPAEERDGPSPFRRSRSTPIRRPIPSATMRFRIIESKMVDLPALVTPAGTDRKEIEREDARGHARCGRGPWQSLPPNAEELSLR